nr:hypothetical protein [Tanacetum cinerariifolium]
RTKYFVRHTYGVNADFDCLLIPLIEDKYGAQLILNHISSLEALNKHHNEKAETLITPIRLTFGEEGDSNKEQDRGKGTMEEVDDDLKKPYKEVLKSPFPKRIIEFSARSHRMPTDSCQIIHI